MSETQLERSVLEAKERDELFAIADALGAKPGTRAKKADLVTQIFRATGIEPQDAGEVAEKPRRSRARRSTACLVDAAPGSPGAPSRQTRQPQTPLLRPRPGRPPRPRPLPSRRARPRRGGRFPRRQAGPSAPRRPKSSTRPARPRRPRPGRPPVPPADPSRPARPPDGLHESARSRPHPAGHKATVTPTVKGRTPPPGRPYLRRPPPAPLPPPARWRPARLVGRRVPSVSPRPPTVIFLALDRHRHQWTPCRTGRVGRSLPRSTLPSVAPLPVRKDAASRADRIDPGRRWSETRREAPTATSPVVRAGPVAGPDHSTPSPATAETVAGGDGTASSGPIGTSPVRPRRASIPGSRCR